MSGSQAAAVKAPKAISVKPVSRPGQAAAGTKMYWVGVLGDAFSFVTAGGVCFPALTERRSDNGVVHTNRGQRLPLTDEQVAAVQESVANKYVQLIGGRLRIRDIRTRGYSPGPKDEPLGKYLFMVVMDGPLTLEIMDNPPAMVSGDE